MRPTPERAWADDHPQGGATFIQEQQIHFFYNFGINKYDLKREHVQHIEKSEFSDFLTDCFRRNRAVDVIGIASQSGRSNANSVLSARRAVAVKEEIVTRVRQLRLQGLFGRFGDEFLDRMITTTGLGSQSLIQHRIRDPLRLPAHDPVMEYAYSRSVLVRMSPVGRLQDEQIEEIGRRYIRSKYRSFNLPTNFRFWDLWTPNTQSLIAMVPDPYIRFNGPRLRRGTTVPDGRNWSRYRPGHLAIDALFLSSGQYFRLQTEFQRYVYSTAEVHRIIFQLVNRAEAAKNQLHSLERDLYEWVRRSQAAGGGGAAREPIIRYQRFRDSVFLSGTVCLLQYNGFRPIVFR